MALRWFGILSVLVLALCSACMHRAPEAVVAVMEPVKQQPLPAAWLRLGNGERDPQRNEMLGWAYDGETLQRAIKRALSSGAKVLIIEVDWPGAGADLGVAEDMAKVFATYRTQVRIVALVRAALMDAVTVIWPIDEWYVTPDGYIGNPTCADWGNWGPSRANGCGLLECLPPIRDRAAGLSKTRPADLIAWWPLTVGWAIREGQVKPLNEEIRPSDQILVAPGEVTWLSAQQMCKARLALDVVPDLEALLQRLVCEPVERLDRSGQRDLDELTAVGTRRYEMGMSVARRLVREMQAMEVADSRPELDAAYSRSRRLFTAIDETFTPGSRARLFTWVFGVRLWGDEEEHATVLRRLYLTRHKELETVTR